MKQLEKEFTGIGEVRGFVFRQMTRTNRGFIYEVSACGTLYYEVFKRRINKQYNNESYPRSKSFGNWAWTTKSLDKANQILNQIQLQAK